MRVFFKRSFFVFLALIFNALFTNLSYGVTGVEWLSSIQNANGSYVTSTDVATATQSTVETLLFIVFGYANAELFVGISCNKTTNDCVFPISEIIRIEGQARKSNIEEILLC